MNFILFILFITTSSLLASYEKKLPYSNYVHELSISTAKLQGKLPVSVDKMTKLIKIKSEGLSLSYTYSLNYDESGNQSKTIDETMWPKDRKEFEKELSSSQKVFNTATS